MELAGKEDNTESNLSDEKLEKRVSGFYNNFSTWINKKSNLAIIIILIFAITIRIYYFIFTKDQALWWDALSYGAIAKNFISQAWWDLPLLNGELIIRPYLLSFLWSLLMRAGAEEATSKFILEVIPSTLSVLFIYLIGKKMYGKRVGLVSAVILSFLWIHIFYSMRMLTSVPSMFFSLVSIYFFLQAGDKLKFKEYTLAIFFLSLSLLTRYPFGLIVGGTYFLFLISTQKLRFASKKSFWIGSLIGIIPILIFLLVNLNIHGNVFPAASTYAESASKKESFAWHTLGFIPYILQVPLFYLFLIGLVIALTKLLIGFDLITNSKKQQMHFLNILLLLLTLIFLIFYIKASEDRYLFTAIVPLLLFTSLGIFSLYDLVKKHSKLLGIVFLVVLLGWGMYANLGFADNMIKGKAHSFKEMKETFLWMNENLPKGSVVIGESSELYVIYYAPNLIPKTWPEPPEVIPSDSELNADYVVITAYHWQWDNVREYLQTIQDRLKPVTAGYVGGNTQQQPSVIVYEYV